MLDQLLLLGLSLFAPFLFGGGGLDLAEVFQAVGDGEGAVGFALFADAGGVERVGEVGPVVVASVEFLPGLLQRLAPFGEEEELPEGRGGDLHAVVEVGLPARGPVGEFVAQGEEFGAEGFGLGEVVAGLASAFAGVVHGPQPHQILLDLADFGFHELLEALVERVGREAVIVNPERVVAAGGGERPVDGRLPAALGIAFQVVGEEAGGLAEIVAHGLHAEDFAGFVFYGLGRGAALLATPDDFDDLADAALDVQRVIRVIHEDAVPRNLNRIIPDPFFLHPSDFFLPQWQSLRVL